jgi:hypothetical protein
MHRHRRGASRRLSSAEEPGVEIAVADLNDEAIFVVTDCCAKTGSATAAMEMNYTQGVNMAKAASKIPTLQHYIWSTFPNSTGLSLGKITVPHFQGKARVDDSIRHDVKLLATTIFLMFGIYAEAFVKASTGC